MLDKPLQPFAPPSILFTQFHWSGVVSGSAAVIGAFAGIFIFWALYTLVAVYHWLKYSHASWVALPAIALHLFLSFVLFTYAISVAFFLP